MREKINENPMAQIGVVAILILAVGYLLMTRVLGGDEPVAAVPPAGVEVSVTATSPTGESATVTGAVPVGASALPTAGGVPVIEDAPLPKPVVSAYESGATVALLLVKHGGIDDAKLESAVRNRLAGVARAKLFVDTAENVSKYTQITQAVNLDRVPALIVLRPKALGGDTVSASVSYGFRDPASIEQMVTDALFNGRIVGYSPD